MKVEDMIEAYLEKREEDAWEKVKSKVTSDKFSKSMNGLIKNAFLIGYGAGGVDAQEEIVQLYKIDPVGFFNWINEDQKENKLN